jgi:hypothetical protein
MRGGSDNGSGNGFSSSVSLSGKAVIFPDDVPRKECRGSRIIIESFPWTLLSVRHVIVNTRHTHAETHVDQNGRNWRGLPMHTVLHSPPAHVVAQSVDF